QFVHPARGDQANGAAQVRTAPGWLDRDLVRPQMLSVEVAPTAECSAAALDQEAHSSSSSTGPEMVPPFWARNLRMPASACRLPRRPSGSSAATSGRRDSG